MKIKLISFSLFTVLVVAFFAFVPEFYMIKVIVVLKNIFQFFAWSESSRDYWLNVTNSREFVFLAFFGKDVFSIFANLGIFRVITLPVLKLQGLINWFFNIKLVQRLLLYKRRLVIKANSGVLVWQIFFFIILFVLSIAPVPYLQTVAVGLYVLAFFAEKSFAKLLGHYAFYALLFGSFLKYVMVIYTRLFDNLFFVQF